MNEIIVREYREEDLSEMVRIWNEVVEAGKAFPQIDVLDIESAREFFAEQSITCVAVEGHGSTEKVCGLYILHPNNIGRLSHIANASYAVDSEIRGRGVGQALVADSLEQTRKLGFKGLQFNAVVASNLNAIHVYEKLGFTRVGTIPGGFKNINSTYEDMHIFFKSV